MRKKIGKIKSLHLKRRERRKLSIRKKIIGTASIPRISPFKSNKNLFIQVIDDQAQRTLFSIQSFGKQSPIEKTLNMKTVLLLGKQLSEKLKEKNIVKVVFDRNGYKYTGILKNLLEVVREQGVQV